MQTNALNIESLPSPHLELDQGVVNGFEHDSLFSLWQQASQIERDKEHQREIKGFLYDAFCAYTTRLTLSPCNNPHSTL